MDKHNTLSGAMVRRLMRRHRITIAGLAAKHNITQKRVREVRAKGVAGFLAQKWCYLIGMRGKPCPSDLSRSDI